MNEPGALAQWVDYRQLAIRRGVITGDVDLSKLPRVAAELACGTDTQALVSAKLWFDEDAQRRVRVAGTIRTALELRCQRCLNAFDQPMTVDVSGVVVGNDAAAASVPRADEPILADTDTLDVYALVSDELLLAMPSVARCDRLDCVTRYNHLVSEPDPVRDKEQTNPFAVLGTLKRDRD